MAFQLHATYKIVFLYTSYFNNLATKIYNLVTRLNKVKTKKLILNPGTVPDDFFKIDVSYYQVFSHGRAIPCPVFQQLFWFSHQGQTVVHQHVRSKFQHFYSQKDLRGRNCCSVVTVMYKMYKIIGGIKGFFGFIKATILWRKYC